MRFLIVVAMYNMEPWIAENIRSIKNQTLRDFRCFIGDDMSTDNSAVVVRDLIRDDSRFELILHKQKKYSMGNIRTLIDIAKPENEDVIVLVDGDDHLAHDHVLERIKDIYSERDCWMTYGSYSGDGHTVEKVCRPYSARCIAKNKFKSVKWRASHLKTFKYGLWKRIPPASLSITVEEFNSAIRRALLTFRWRAWRHWRNIDFTALVSPCGNFVRRCDDKTFTLAMLELAGRRSHFVNEILYIYVAYEKDLNFDRKKFHQKWYLRLIRDILKHKPRLKPLESLD
jgi:glycosyltransferase involved in cell wall biosynthesis